MGKFETLEKSKPAVRRIVPTAGSRLLVAGSNFSIAVARADPVGFFVLGIAAIDFSVRAQEVKVLAGTAGQNVCAAVVVNRAAFCLSRSACLWQLAS